MTSSLPGEGERETGGELEVLQDSRSTSHFMRYVGLRTEQELSRDLPGLVML